MARSALAEAKINTNPTQPARSRAPAVPDTCPSLGQREARPGVAGGARESVRDAARVVVEMECGIRTRLTQGAGRATCNSADYAAALMLGHDLANFCAQPGVQSAARRSAPSCALGWTTAPGCRPRTRWRTCAISRTRTGASPSRTSSLRARRWPAPARPAPSSSPPHRTRSPQWTPPGRATGRPRSTRQGSADPPGR